MPEYIPGTCNIGGPEVQLRKNVGYFGLLLTIATLFFFLAVRPAMGARTIIFFPVLLTTISWFQTRERFCLAFGLAGTFNFGPAGKLAKVSNPADLRADRAKVIRVFGKAFALACVVSALVIFSSPN